MAVPVCWSLEQTPNVFPIQAHEQTDHIFASVHTEISDFKIVKSPSKIDRPTDKKFFQYLNSRKENHRFGVIKGAPGTGKSHFIRWMYHEWKRENPEDKTIFIPRRDATLQSALTKMIEDLEGFEDLAEKLSSVSVQLNSQGLAQSLINELCVLLDPDNIEERYQNDQLVKDSRFVSFIQFNPIAQAELKQEGGIIQRVISKIVSSENGVNEDYNIESFTENDIITLFNHSKDSIEDVVRLNMDRTILDDQLLGELVEAVNGRLELAQQKIIGLNPQDLRQIFEGLRRKIKTRLVLMIEDVSCFQGVDQQLIEIVANPYEQVQDTEFAPLVAVIGITDQYYKDYIEPKGHMTDRINDIINLSSQSNISDSVVLSDHTKTTSFIARYLNAARMPEEKLKSWANDPERNVEEPPNFCSKCEFLKTCHEAFGEAHGFGLYPFNKRIIEHLPTALLDQGKPEKTIAFTPRNLMGYVKFILESFGDNDDGQFPLSVLKSPDHLDKDLVPALNTRDKRVLENQFSDKADQFEVLVSLYGDNSVTRKPVSYGGVELGIFEQFGLSLEHLDMPVEDEKDDEEEDDEEEDDEKKEEESEHRKRLNEINAWKNNNVVLEYDVEVRTRLYKYLSQTIDWERLGVNKTLSQEFRATRIKIENQRGTTHAPIVTFKHNPETFDVLMALYEFEKTTDQAGVILHTDVLVRFARKHGPKIAKKLLKFVTLPDGSIWKPEKYAAQILAIDALINSKGKVNIDDSSLIRHLLAKNDEARTGDGDRSAIWNRLRDYLRRHREELKNILMENFLHGEQFVDPTDILKALEDLARQDSILDFEGCPQNLIEGLSDEAPINLVVKHAAKISTDIVTAIDEELANLRNFLTLVDKEEIGDLTIREFKNKIEDLITAILKVNGNACPTEIAQWRRASQNSLDLWEEKTSWDRATQKKKLEVIRNIISQPHRPQNFVELIRIDSQEIEQGKMLLETGLELYHVAKDQFDDEGPGNNGGDEALSQNLKKIKDLAKGILGDIKKLKKHIN